MRRMMSSGHEYYIHLALECVECKHTYTDSIDRGSSTSRFCAFWQTIREIIFFKSNLSINMSRSSSPELDLLCCSICFELFKDPITTPCGHSFCRQCLLAWGKKQSDVDADGDIPCPVCRNVMDAYEVDVLKRSVSLARMVESGQTAARGAPGAGSGSAPASSSSEVADLVKSSKDM